MSPRHGRSLGQRERRRHQRFPLAIEAAVFAGGMRGTASVRNLSSGGIFVRTEMMMAVGADVTLIIDWPAAVPGRGCLLTFVIEGTVLRSDQTGTAIKIHKYASTLGAPQLVTKSRLPDKSAGTSVPNRGCS